MLIAIQLNTLFAQIAQGTPAGPASDSQWMVYAIIAFGMAIALLVLEAFVPSGGVLGTLAGFCAVGGIVMFFMFDDIWGMVSMAVTLAALPFLIAGMLWIWPRTPIGRAMTLDTSQARSRPDQSSRAEQDPSAITVGLEGEALTELRPVGACRLNGKRMDCISQAGVIDPGTRVRVIQVDGMTIKVKAI